MSVPTFVSNPPQAAKPADPRRAIPSVEKLLQAIGPVDLPRPLVVAEIRRLVAGLRENAMPAGFEAIIGRAREALAALARSRLQPVINGTGIVLHTNFGRAPLGESAIQALTAVAAGYSNLEFDLDSRERGSRAAYLERALALACGAEAATVVNNCAAALVLVIRHFTAQRREVLLSRGELIQIGGGFRIPEILEASGAVLREVGTTNQTSLDDYARAIGPATGLMLKVHRSNFFMEGFVASPSTDALAAVARAHDIPLVEDLGSGALLATESVAGLDHEPTPAETLARGADLVTFSGDKLLGGPQAGIIAGRAAWIAALKREPFFRALRCDKLVFAALQATVESYLNDDSSGLPIHTMLRVPLTELRTRAEKIIAQCRGAGAEVGIVETAGQVGAGSLPRSELPSLAIEFRAEAMRVDEFSTRLARGWPPVVGIMAGDCYRIDLRTVFPRQDEALAAAIRAALGDD